MHSTIAKVGLVALAAVASIGIILAASGSAKQFFTQAAGEYAPLDAPTAVPADNTVTITWKTKAPVVSVIKYGSTASDLSVPVFEAVQTADHKVTITGLVPDKTYYYEIVASEKAYTDTGGKPYEFHTLPSNRPQPTYPPCDVKAFEGHYAASRGDVNYDTLYDVNGDGTINSNDFFECLKANPPQ